MPLQNLKVVNFLYFIRLLVSHFVRFGLLNINLIDISLLSWMSSNILFEFSEQRATAKQNPQPGGVELEIATHLSTTRQQLSSVTASVLEVFKSTWWRRILVFLYLHSARRPNGLLFYILLVRASQVPAPQSSCFDSSWISFRHLVTRCIFKL